MHFSTFLHEIFRINVKLNFFLMLYSNYLFWSHDKFGGQTPNFSDTNRIMLVSFKNIHIWLNNGQKWHAYVFWLLITRLTIFIGTLETIIYRLLVRNPSYDAYYFSVTILCATFGRKMGVATSCPL